MTVSDRRISTYDAGLVTMKFLSRTGGKKSSGGFSYMGLLFLLAILALSAAAALKIGNVTHRRIAEEALLDIGREFSSALEHYRKVTPAGMPDEPMSLQDLLKDNRFPGVVRHLRKAYADPLTGRAEWGLQRSEASKRIVGIYSLAEGVPVKTGNFETFFKNFNGMSSYEQWLFTGMLASAANGGVTAGSTISPLSLSDAPAAESTPGSLFNNSGTNSGATPVADPSVGISPLQLK